MKKLCTSSENKPYMTQREVINCLPHISLLFSWAIMEGGDILNKPVGLSCCCLWQKNCWPLWHLPLSEIWRTENQIIYIPTWQHKHGWMKGHLGSLDWICIWSYFPSCIFIWTFVVTCFWKLWTLSPVYYSSNLTWNLSSICISLWKRYVNKSLPSWR